MNDHEHIYADHYGRRVTYWHRHSNAANGNVHGGYPPHGYPAELNEPIRTPREEPFHERRG